MKEKAKIDFVGIGARKCATTWIYESLRAHPDIYITSPKDRKETAFFIDGNFRERIRNFSTLHKKENKGKIKGNFNAMYLEKEGVAERIKNYNSEMKIIVSLRNPIERAYSHYFHGSSREEADWGNFEESIKKAKDRIIEPGFYHKLLKEYYKLFPRENILVILYKDIDKRPEEVLKRLYNFLEVDSSFRPWSLDKRVAPTQFKHTSVGKFIYGKVTPLFSKTRLGRKIINLRVIKEFFYHFVDLYNKGESKPDMNPETRKQLKEVYRKDIEKLEKLINKDLSYWN